MSAAPAGRDIAAVVVLYHPEISVFEHLAQLSASVDFVVAVINAIDAELLDTLERLFRKNHRQSG